MEELWVDAELCVCRVGDCCGLPIKYFPNSKSAKSASRNVEVPTFLFTMDGLECMSEWVCDPGPKYRRFGTLGKMMALVETNDENYLVVEGPVLQRPVGTVHENNHVL